MNCRRVVESVIGERISTLMPVFADRNGHGPRLTGQSAHCAAQSVIPLVGIAGFARRVAFRRQNGPGKGLNWGKTGCWNLTLNP